MEPTGKQVLVSFPIVLLHHSVGKGKKNQQFSNIFYPGWINYTVLFSPYDCFPLQPESTMFLLYFREIYYLRAHNWKQFCILFFASLTEQNQCKTGH